MNDVKAFKAAHVGIAMGSGCSYAKNNASIVLVDDEFRSAVSGIQWGRNIYTNIKRFLQFQVQINFAVIIITLMGYSKFGAPVLTIVDLLWINLIMDTLGALALATLPPSPSVIRQNPTGEDFQVMDKIIWRQIYGITAYQIIYFFITIYFGSMIYDFDVTRTDQVCLADDNGEPILDENNNK